MTAVSSFASRTDDPKSVVNLQRAVTKVRVANNLSFLNKYLQGQNDHLLDGPPDPSAFPRVFNFKKK